MALERSCGILCHPTCMPGPYGIGDLGHGCRRFIDFLVDAGQSFWQILPLGPTGYGDSPYQSFSAFAGNPLLIDLDRLLQDGLLAERDIVLPSSLPEDGVLFRAAIAFKDRALRRSYERLSRRACGRLRPDLLRFRQANSHWLDDYALFMALKREFQGAVWTEWDRDIALREKDALVGWSNALRDEVDFQVYLQFTFDRQWESVREYARDAGVRIIGDVPIFVGHDSSDVWSHRELFQLDDIGYPTVVAGVPPDYFSATGQLWGNPLYRWDLMARDDYAWWMSRLRRALSQVDMVRLDHFRGFSGYWEVLAGEETAVNGRWVRGPGESFFRAAEREFGQLPIIAEDLGVISPDVAALRKQFGLPGMKVLQFAFDSDARNTDLPHNYTNNCLVYTGTHDNDTTLGWYASRDEEVRHRVRLYTGTDGSEINWTFIRLAMTSVADLAMVPLQDVLSLGSEARLNLPGRSHGNWTWRYRQDSLHPVLATSLRELAIASARFSEPDQEREDEAAKVIEYEEP